MTLNAFYIDANGNRIFTDLQTQSVPVGQSITGQLVVYGITPTDTGGNIIPVHLCTKTTTNNSDGTLAAVKLTYLTNVWQMSVTYTDSLNNNYSPWVKIA